MACVISFLPNSLLINAKGVMINTKMIVNNNPFMPFPKKCNNFSKNKIYFNAIFGNTNGNNANAIPIIGKNVFSKR